MQSYHVGTTVTLTGVARDEDGNAADPTTITVKVVEPDGVVVGYVYADGEVTKTDTGIYKVEHPLTKAGTHIVRFEGTGDVAAAEEASFTALEASC